MDKVEIIDRIEASIIDDKITPGYVFIKTLPHRTGCEVPSTHNRKRYYELKFTRSAMTNWIEFILNNTYPGNSALISAWVDEQLVWYRIDKNPVVVNELLGKVNKHLKETHATNLRSASELIYNELYHYVKSFGVYLKEYQDDLQTSTTAPVVKPSKLSWLKFW